MLYAMQPDSLSRRHRPIVAISFTIVMIVLLIFATHPIAHELSFLMVAAIVVAVGLCNRLLPGSLFFTLALANLIAVYASFFVIILDSHFRTLERPWQWVGFMLPLVAFFAGVLLHRRAIRQLVVQTHEPDPAEYAHALLTLFPLLLIALAAMMFASTYHSLEVLRFVFLAAMGLSSALIFFASRNMVIFLLITGLLFESFFHRMAKMTAPVFAFFTFYSFVVLMFGAIYTGIDTMTGLAHFRVMGESRLITFPEGLYYSLVTLATVGYGDIVPVRNLTRLVSSLEMVTGVLLLLFGFNEIMSYSREIRNKGRKE